MGRKSKRRGKSKRGGKQQHSPSDRTAEIITPFSSINLSKEGSVALQGNNTVQTPELKTQRDEFVEEATSANDQDDNVAKDYFIALTSQRRKFIVETADVLFDDKGAKFRMEYTEAADEAVALMEKMNNDGHDHDGDTDDQLCIMRDTLRTMNKLVDEKLKEYGHDSPFAHREEPLHGTIFDDDLFQPCPPRPDCPICFVTLPERDASCYHPCCGKTVCDGCVFAHRDAMRASHTDFCCPFCRDAIGSVNECDKKSEERMKYGDCEAFYMLGTRYFTGMPPLKQNHKKGLELLDQAAELGSTHAHHTLGEIYAFGKGVKIDEGKAFYHLRLAAIGGVLESRHLLGEWYRPQHPNLAYKHFIIAAEAGHDKSLKEVKTGYAKGYVEKDVLEKVLRAHQAAKDAVKSEARYNADSRRRQEGSGRYNPHHTS